MCVGCKEIEENAKFHLQISENVQLEDSLRAHGSWVMKTSLRLYIGFLEAAFGFLLGLSIIVLFLLFGTATCVSLNPLMPD